MTVTWGDALVLAAPAATALAVAAAGAVLARRRPGLMLAVAPLAALAGWTLVFPDAWRAALWPRTLGEHLLLPVLVFAAAGALPGRLQNRWLAAGTAGFAGWWLAGSGVGRPEFWRVWFASAIVAWALARSGAAQPRRALAACLTLLAGLVAGSGSAAWTSAMAVLAAAALGMLAGRRGASVPPGLSMLGLVAADLAAGRAVRGGLGLIDLACLGAVAAPWVVAPAERWLRRRRKGLDVMAPPVVAAVLTACAWIVLRVLRPS